mmetsp:Transcript_36851/g.61213  ORF Transcript_36851/g.61213 Transcript_36851/m.61213 type:complete len:276 (+) Transcript_36851:19-846(+)
MQREAAWIDYMEPLFTEMKEHAPRQLNENSQSFLQQEDTLKMLIELRPAVVSFHFGIPPAEWISALRQEKIITMATATNPQDARIIEDAGIDMIVAQGVEAGGHRGMFDPDAVDERLSTFSLVQLLARQTSLPIIAAGGIMDGRGIKAALSLGASAIQLGTAFVLCPESSANDNYRKSIKGPGAATTRLTYVISGRPARGIANRLISHGEREGAPRPPDFPIAYDLTRCLNALEAKHQNHGDFAAHWAGQGAPLARELPAERLVEQLIKEWNEAD